MLLKEIRRLLAPPSFESEDKTHIALLLNTISLALVAAAVCNVVFLLLIQREPLSSPRVVFSSTGIFLAIPTLAVLRRGQVKAAVMIFCASMWIATTIAVPILGGILAAAFDLYIVVIVIAGLLLGGTAAMVFTAMSAAAGLIVLLLQSSGALPRQPASLADVWAGKSLIFMVVAVVLRLTSRSLNHALARVQMNEEELSQRNRQLEHEIGERRQVEEALRQSHESAQQFMDKLRALHEVSIDLSKAATLDELCRHAVELGRSRLGFDRLSLWFLDSDPAYMVGSFGTDEHGQIRDEHQARTKYNFEGGMDEVLDGMVLVSNNKRSVPLYDYHQEIIGWGWQGAGKLWSGDTQIGWLFTDNFLQKQPFSESMLKLLALYAATIGQLVTLKRAEKALREREEHYRIIGGLVSDYAYLYRIDEDGNWSMDWLIGSPEALTGFDLNVLQGPYRVFHPEDDERARLDVEQTLKGIATDGDYRVLTKDETVRWLHIRRQPIWNAERKRFDGFYAAVQDITERKKAEEELLAEHHLLRTVIDTIPDYIYVKDTQSRFVIANVATAHDMGAADVEAMIGKTDFDFLSRDEAQAYFDDEQTTIFAGGGELNFESVTPSRSGKVHSLLIKKFPYRDKKGTILGLVGINQDITERRRAERQALELAVTHERAESLTNFLSTMSHDLKTPLTVMRTSLYLLERITDPAKQQDKINSLKAQVQLLEKYIQDILTISRLDHMPELQQEAVNLNSLLSDIVERLRASAEQKNLTITLDLPQDSLLVSGDRNELDRVLVNLLENALVYTPAAGTIVTRTRSENIYAVIEITDTGMGIGAEDLPHIFERFYRSKQALAVESRGTGLGLAIVKRVIEMHGGKIEVDSVLGQGSTFRVYLPARVGLLNEG